MGEELKDLKRRLSSIIINTCNKVGCTNCDLKWDESCSATELDTKIREIEIKEINLNETNNQQLSTT